MRRGLGLSLHPGRSVPGSTLLGGPGPTLLGSEDIQRLAQCLEHGRRSVHLTDGRVDGLEDVGQAAGAELRTEAISWGGVPTGPRLRSPWPSPRGICPRAHTVTPKSLPKGFTCWQRAGGPGGQLARALTAWATELSLASWPGALRTTGVHFLSPYAQESRRQLPVEAETVGRRRGGGPGVLVAGHLLRGGDPARTPGSARPGTGWRGGFAQAARAGGRWMPTGPGPAEAQLGQAPAGRPGSPLSVEQSEPGGWLESQGTGAEGSAGESGQWPRWRSQRLPAGARAAAAPTAPASR